MSGSNPNNIKIVALEEKFFPDVVELFNEGFGSKRCFACIPATRTIQEFNRLHKNQPGKRNIAFLALDTTSEEILGYVQLSKPGLPAFYGLHTCKKNEVYVDEISVSARARGKGIGTKLLEYCEEVARNEEGIEIMTLDVLRGNPALGLYERFGFEIDRKRVWVEYLRTCLVLVFMGRPYGCCHPKCGVDFMVKKL